jgi:ABC-type branched-subunit amino acid transport system ATPase component
VSALEVTDLTVRFGGLTALDAVSLRADGGRITGLIGPNGAGKSTLFNACSGLVKPQKGAVTLHGRDVTRAGPSTRAQLGLGRTFQRMELFDRMSVADNVLIGAEARATGRKLHLTTWQPRRLRDNLRATRDATLELCGLTQLRSEPAGALSTGQKRLVELARAVAGGFSILLLDEPSSGLDHAETTQFGRVLQHVVAESRAGILLVEHDISLVTAVCEYTYVLEFGRLIEQGPTGTVMASDAVRSAYLGTEVA